MKVGSKKVYFMFISAWTNAEFLAICFTLSIAIVIPSKKLKMNCLFGMIEENKKNNFSDRENIIDRSCEKKERKLE